MLYRISKSDLPPHPQPHPHPHKVYRTYPRSHANKCAHAHAYTHAYARSHTLTRVHTLTRTRTHVRPGVTEARPSSTSTPNTCAGQLVVGKAAYDKKWAERIREVNSMKGPWGKLCAKEAATLPGGRYEMRYETREKWRAELKGSLGRGKGAVICVTGACHTNRHSPHLPPLTPFPLLPATTPTHPTPPTPLTCCM